MTQAQLLSLGIRVHPNSSFSEITSRLQPLWQSFEKRKYKIPFNAKTVAKMLVHDKYVHTLIQKLEASQMLFTKRVTLLTLESKKKHKESNCTENLDMVIEKAKSLKVTICFLKKQFDCRFIQLRQLFESMPNQLHETVPDKVTVIKTYQNVPKSGTKKIHSGAACKDHVQLGEELDLFDIQTGSDVAGHRFVYLKGNGALLANALEQWVISVLLSHDFLLMSTPDVIKNEIVKGCGFRPEGPATQVYGVIHGKTCNTSLAGTGEIPLVGYFANKNVEQDLSKSDIRVCAASNCYRAEAGDRGKAIRGLYRLHQFRKVEMVCITKPNKNQSKSVFTKLVNIQESIYRSLELPYRLVNIPADDLGHVAHRKVDIEVFMPGMGYWGEVTSASECLSYQSSRLKILDATEFAYTLNATAIAIPRTLIGIIENNQLPDGGILLPKVLQPFMKCTMITPKRRDNFYLGSSNRNSKKIFTTWLDE